jgi:hypothetical protein
MGTNRIIKYFGSLKDLDFDNVDEISFQKLLKNKVLEFYEEHKEEDRAYFKANNIEYPVLKTSINSFWSDFYNNYYTFSKSVFTEMEIFDGSKIENYSDADKIILSIDLEIEKTISKKRKKEIINFNYNKYFSLLNECDLREQYPLYINGTKHDKLNNWTDLYAEILIDCGQVKPIIDFLKGVDYFYNTDMKEDWLVIYKVAKICGFCKKKKAELKNKDKAFISNDFTKLESETNFDKNEFTFKDDGLAIFNYVATSYSDKKDPAFFSYLYLFLKSKNKTISQTEDNKKYREYVKMKFGVNMSRIIKSNANSPQKETSMFEIFSTYLKSYSDND